MLKTGLCLKRVVHYVARLWWRVRFVVRSDIFAILIILISSTLACEIGRPFVFMCASILLSCQWTVGTDDGSGDANVLKAADGLVYVARRKLVELLVTAEDDNSDINRA